MPEVQSVQSKPKGRSRRDWANSRFGNLTVIADAASDGANRRLLCRCDCGTEKEVFLSNLHSGSTRSCGCTAVLVAPVVRKHTRASVYRLRERIRESYLAGGGEISARMVAEQFNVSASYVYRVIKGLPKQVRNASSLHSYEKIYSL